MTALDQAIALHLAGRLKEAERSYRQLLAQRPDFPEALHLLGLVALQAGRPHDAERLISRAIALAPCFAEAHSNLGLAMTAMGRGAEAAAFFRRAIALRPDYPEAHYNLGLAADTAGDWPRALDCYDRAIALRSGYADAHANRAMVLHALERPVEAVAAYRHALELLPDAVRLRTYLGLALLRDGEFDAARAELGKAAAVQPDAALTQLGLASLAYEDGDVAGAEAHLVHGLALVMRDLPPPAAPAPAPVPAKQYPTAMYPDALCRVCERLAAAGIEPFLVGGTLIGAMRDGDFLSFDKDIDFGVPASVTPGDLRRAFESDPAFTPMYGTDDEGALLVGFWFRDRVAVDFFRFFAEGERVWCGMMLNGHPMKWMHRPFALADFSWHGVAVKVPDDADRFLTEAYGDWRVPNPHFGVFASPNIEGGFPLISRCLAYGMMVNAALAGDRARLDNLCRQVLALAPEDATANAVMAWLGKVSPGPAPLQAYTQAAIAQAAGHAFDNLPG